MLQFDNEKRINASDHLATTASCCDNAEFSSNFYFFFKKILFSSG
jgi:hypothetical protein